MRRVGLGALVAAFAPGEHVFLPGCCGEAPAFTAALAADPAHTRGVRLTTSFVPGINTPRLERLATDAQVRCLFPHLEKGVTVGLERLQPLPVSYAGFVRNLRHGPAFDTVVVHVAPPDREGRCSLGPSTEFTRLAAAKSRRVLAVLNPRLPVPASGAWIDSDDIALACEIEDELVSYDPGSPDPAISAIGHGVADLIEDGAIVQLGLGKAPAAVATALAKRRGLRVWSGMVGDWWLDLAEAGALAPDAEHLCCSAVGSDRLYAALAASPQLRIAGCEVTHDPGRLAALSPFYAVNAALEIDLYGQCNLEQVGGRWISGAGGAPDFMRAASKGAGAGVVVLPSVHGGRSRIVARLDSEVVTLARQDVDIVVTEHGAADLRGLDLASRAQALIDIAAPAFREHLAADFSAGAVRPTRG